MKDCCVCKKEECSDIKCSDIFRDNTCSNFIPKFQNKKNITDFFVEMLISMGVTTVSGLTSTFIIDFYNAVNANKNLISFMTRDEQNAAFGTLGLSRISSLKLSKRKLSVAYSDQGPGLANMINAITAATLERLPAIFVTVQNIGTVLENRLVQNVSSKELVKNIAKSYLVIEIEDVLNGTIVDKIYETMIRGFSYPAGAIVIIFNGISSSIEAQQYYDKINYYKSLFSDMFDSEYGISLKKSLEVKWPDPFTGLFSPEWILQKEKFLIDNASKIVLPENYLELFKTKLTNSQYPIMLIGLGALNYINELTSWCKKNGCPFIFTLPMNGFANQDDPYYAFRMGHTASYCGNQCIVKCDLLIGWGVSFNNYTTLNYETSLSHISSILSINPYPELYNTPFVTNYLIDEGQNVLENILSLDLKIDRQYWLNLIKLFKKEGNELNGYFYSKTKCDKLRHGDIFNSIQKYLNKYIKKDRKVVFYTDTGLCQPFTASFIKFKENYRFTTDCKYASIGAGLGELLAASINNPEILFIFIAGDSATLDRSISDYITLRELNPKNLITIILENSGIGLIEEENIELNYQLKYINGFKYFPKWKKLFNSLLVDSYVVGNVKKLNKALKCTFKNLYKKPSVIVSIVPIDAYYSPVIEISPTSKYSDMNYLELPINTPTNNCRYKLLSSSK